MSNDKASVRTLFCTTFNTGRESLTELLEFNFKHYVKSGRLSPKYELASPPNKRHDTLSRYREVLSFWIPIQKHCDLYCIALQECTHISDEEVHLLADFFSSIGHEKYVLVANESMGTLNVHPKPRIGVFARASATVDEISYITKVVGRGLNKGAVAVEFRLDGQFFCVVCAHLNSGANKIKIREKDFLEVYTELIEDDYSAPQLSERQRRGVSFDHIIFMGDLNCRVQLPGHEEESSEQFNQVLQLIDKHDWDTLAANDELDQQLELNPLLLPGFTEMKRPWAPTYRLERGSKGYGYKMKMGKPFYQAPSYTDRILYRTGGRFWLVADTYHSAHEFLGSDHRPVNATFHIHDTQPPRPAADNSNSTANNNNNDSRTAANNNIVGGADSDTDDESEDYVELEMEIMPFMPPPRALNPAAPWGVSGARTNSSYDNEYEDRDEDALYALYGDDFEQPPRRCLTGPHLRCCSTCFVM